MVNLRIGSISGHLFYATLGATAREKCIACKMCELRCPDLAIEVITEE